MKYQVTYVALQGKVKRRHDWNGKYQLCVKLKPILHTGDQRPCENFLAMFDIWSVKKAVNATLLSLAFDDSIKMLNFH